VIATLDSGTGGSSCAINFAYEKSLFNRETLLLDFNQENPYLARYFDLQRVNRKIVKTRFGFSISEVSETAYLAEVSVAANSFDEIFIDLGKVPPVAHLISGVRVREIATRWSLQSASALYIVTRGSTDSLARLKALSSALSQQAVIPTPTILLISQSSISGRERRTIIEEAERVFDGEVRYLPRDIRALEQAATHRSPIKPIAPKSLLAREFSSIIGAADKRGR
jgi:hypothetical protein